MYGLEQEETKTFGQVCLTARRLVERGVRFVQVFHGGSGNDNNGWDAHSDLTENHTKLSAMVDQPIAGLLKDLKQRGMLDDTLVVWATEFGRSPGVEVRRTTLQQRADATIILLGSPPGWPAAGSRAVCPRRHR